MRFPEIKSLAATRNQLFSLRMTHTPPTPPPPQCTLSTTQASLIQLDTNKHQQFLASYTLSLLRAMDLRSETAIKLLGEFLDCDEAWIPPPPPPSSHSRRTADSESRMNSPAAKFGMQGRRGESSGGVFAVRSHSPHPYRPRPNHEERRVEAVLSFRNRVSGDSQILPGEEGHGGSEQEPVEPYMRAQQFVHGQYSPSELRGHRNPFHTPSL
jgi:hypothetical protein